MIQKEFAERTTKILSADPSVIGLTVGGSWITSELDEFSDLDLILVTKEKISGNKELMITYAKRLGKFLSGFTGEHVGEPRVLICLFDDPLLHVDIKFLTLDEFRQRVETPVILLDKNDQLRKVLSETESRFPYPDYQWIEDRFWTWVHYILLKIGRGEYVEAFDCFGLLRAVVFGPLLHIKNSNLPKGVRKVETTLATEDFDKIKSTLPSYSKKSLLDTLAKSISVYRELRTLLFKRNVILRAETEKKVMEYFNEFINRNE